MWKKLYSQKEPLLQFPHVCTCEHAWELIGEVKCVCVCIISLVGKQMPNCPCSHLAVLGSL